MDIKELLARHKAEKDKWVAAGRPMRTKEQMAEIYAVCAQCPRFNKRGGFIPGYDQCDICQCNLHPSMQIMNKIAWDTTNCPNDPPLWEAGTPSEDA